MDIVKLISDKVKEVEANGTLESIVEKHVLTCLDGIVKDSFTWSGEARTALKEALSGKLNVNLENIKIERYQKIVSKVVEDRINGTIVEDLKLGIEETLDKITRVLDKKEYKLSEILSKFVEDIDVSFDEMDEMHGECTLVIEKSSGGYHHIYFDKEEDKEKYRCAHSIHLNDKGKIYHAKFDDKPFSPFRPLNIHGFEAFLFHLYCNNVSIIIDESDCELEYYREDY